MENKSNKMQPNVNGVTNATKPSDHKCNAVVLEGADLRTHGSGKMKSK